MRTNKEIVCSFVASKSQYIKEMCPTREDVEVLNINELEELKDYAVQLIRHIDDLQELSDE